MAQSRGHQGVAIAPQAPLRLGPLDLLPAIVLPNQHGEVVKLLDFMAGNMLVLLLVSDPRLPGAGEQLRRFAGRFQALQQEGNVFVVAQTPPAVNAGIAGGNLPFFILSDLKGELAALLEQVPSDNAERSGQAESASVLIADERMRICRIDPQVRDADHVETVLRYLRERPRPVPRLLSGFAPLLHVPRVLEPAFCERLIGEHRTETSRPAEAPRLVDGKLTYARTAAKIRRDHIVQDPALIAEVMDRVAKRVQPEIMRAFTRQVSGLEEVKVVRYDATDGGHFKAHRDNTMAHFAHRRFAMTIHLNSGDYEGGLLRFPEYGPDLYGPPKGDAIVYSSTLLHEVTPVTAGQRYALLGHIFDEESRQRSPTFRR